MASDPRNNPPPEVRMLALGDIKVSKRVRQDLGHIEELAGSIDYRGLLQPIGVTADNDLVFGERRLRACQLLGWSEIPAVVVTGMDDLVSRLRAEQDENLCRKDLTPSEKVVMADRLRVAATRLARQRQVATRAKPGERVGTPRQGGVSPPTTYRGKARDQVASLLGTSDRTLRAANEVVLAQKDPDPQVRRVAERAREEMDFTGKVGPAVQKVRRARRKALSGVYSGIYEYPLGSGQTRFGFEQWGQRKEGFASAEAAKEYLDRAIAEDLAKAEASEYPRKVQRYRVALKLFEQDFVRADVDLVAMIPDLGKDNVFFTPMGLREAARRIVEFADAWENYEPPPES